MRTVSNISLTCVTESCAADMVGGVVRAKECTTTNMSSEKNLSLLLFDSHTCQLHLPQQPACGCRGYPLRRAGSIWFTKGIRASYNAQLMFSSLCSVNYVIILFLSSEPIAHTVEERDGSDRMYRKIWHVSMWTATFMLLQSSIRVLSLGSTISQEQMLKKCVVYKVEMLSKIRLDLQQWADWYMCTMHSWW